jgi:hyperosmotically inducible protein
MNKKIITPLLIGFLALTVMGCNDTASTTSDAPDSVNQNAPTPSAQSTQSATDDAQSETRANQLESDIRAREQRNDALGSDANRSDEDLASEVRSKLEANIPGGNLTVEVEEGVVTVAGTVPAQDQIAKIQPLAMEIKGVKSVMVKAAVRPAAS